MEAYIPDADDRKQVITEFFANSGQQFLPILDQIARNEAYMHTARGRAAEMADAIRKSAPK